MITKIIIKIKGIVIINIVIFNLIKLSYNLFFYKL